MEVDDERLKRAEAILDYEFTERMLLADALVHSSTGGGGPSPNERLETLGDAVLTLVITETLFLLNASADQGHITTAKSALVSTRTLAAISREAGLTGTAVLGKGVGAHVPNRVAANLFEAAVGAVYLDGGLDAAREAILRLYGGHIHDPAYRVPDPKSRLQQAAHNLYGVLPSYEVTGTSGPPHRKRFRVRAVIAGRAYGEAEAGSKKSAERKAARLALQEMGREGMSVDAEPGTGEA
ncbi:MAG: ribonuclease III [Planctomycetes bacterium]|nr:ribonuclease III [Planctomycetota bacterium]